MKTSVSIFFIAAVYTALAVPLTENVGERKYERFIEFPDGDGVMHKVDLEAEPDMVLLQEISRNSANNYLLYTRRNPTSPQTLVMNNADSITSSNFNPNHQIVVIAHGWLGNQKASLNPTIRDVYTVSGIPLDEGLGPHDYPRIIQIEDQHGVTHEIDLEATPNMEVLEELNNPVGNRYVLFTRNNPTTGQTLVLNVESSIAESNFNPDVPTVVIVHGWMVNQLMTMSDSIRDAFLETVDMNVIVVDWTITALQDFVTSSAATPFVGRGIGQFLAFLHDVTGVPYSTMHLVGFNLGAHAAGIAGRELDGQVSRITGLDPAGILWTGNPARLNENDARYVEGIHTDGGVSGLGIGLPVGDVDFFPNGGISQPGCLTSFCEHNRSWQLFVATVRYNHLHGNQCSNAAQVSLNTCRGQRLPMGNSNINKTGSGLFRVNTGRIHPF